MLFSNEELSSLKYTREIVDYINLGYSEFRFKIEEILKKRTIEESNRKMNLFLSDYDKLFYRIKSSFIMLDNREYFIDSVINNGTLNSTFEKIKSKLSWVMVPDDKELDLMLFNFSDNMIEIYELINDLIIDSPLKKIIISLPEELNSFKKSLTLNFSNMQGFELLLENDIQTLKDRIELLNGDFLVWMESVNKLEKRIEEKSKIEADLFKNKAENLLLQFQHELSNLKTNFINTTEPYISELQDKIDSTDKEFKETFEDYEGLKKLINIKGEISITDHYKRKALWERVTYWVMTILTFIIIGGAICLATLSLNDYKAKTSINIDEWSQKFKNQPIEKIEKIYELQQKNALIYLILRLIISIFLFSSIIYTSRIAYRAYIHMRHSENMRLKLATLRPFINHLDPKDKKQIHKDLIPDYFGKDAGLVDNSNDKFKDLPANVSAVAMKAIEQISGNGSNSSTEKNGKKSDGGTE